MKAVLSVPVPPDLARATSGVQIARRALKQLLTHVDGGSLKWDTRVTLSIEHCKGCEYHRHVCWHSEDVYVESAALLQKAVSLVLHGFDVDVIVNHHKCMPHPHPRLGAFEVKALWHDAAAFTGSSAAAAAATEHPLEVVMFSKIECKLFPDEYSVVAPLVQALCVARSRAAMGINAEIQQQQQQQQQQQRQRQQGAVTRISKRELRLPGDVDPDLMDSLLQVARDM